MPQFVVIFETDRIIVYTTTRIIEAATEAEAKEIGSKMWDSGEVTKDELEEEYDDDMGWNTMDIWATELKDNAKET